MARYRRNLLTVGWVTVALGAPHLADHAGVVLSAFGLLFWDCHLAVEAGRVAVVCGRADVFPS